MTTLASGPLAECLEKNRDVFNARFNLAQRGGARIDGEAFLGHLAELDETLRKLAEHFPERAQTAAVALYELSLELFSESLLGPAARNKAVGAAWRELFPVIPRLLARDARRVAASVSNAVHNIAQASGSRPGQWIESMRAVAGQCDDAALFLKLGKIAAWRAGCPQYRGAALQVARTLPAVLLMPVLFAPGSDVAKIPAALETLAGHRWLSPADALEGAVMTRLRIVKQPGEFRGFGGPFVRPPIAGTQGPQLVLSDGEFIFSLLADEAGCVFGRMAAASVKAVKAGGAGGTTGVVKLYATGNIVWDNAAAGHFPELANYVSAAFDGQTLAITLRDSHRVFLLARG